MKLKAKFLLLAVAPLLLATLAIGTLFVLETASLQKQRCTPPMPRKEEQPF